MADDGPSKMDQLEAVFRKKDAITEPGVLETIKQYVTTGGKPQTVVEMLSESYVGYGAMINVVLDWISTYGQAEATEYKEEEQDSLWKFLKQTVHENFNAADFADVFSSSGGIPEWLDLMIQFPEGRQLIYELTDGHRSCLFLNFAVHHILQQGFDKEVAAVGGSISGNFNVFNRLFLKKLEELYQSKDENTDQVLHQLFQMCCSDEIKYTYSKLILSKLFDAPYGSYFQRFSEQLEAYAAKNAGLTAWKMKSLFLSEATYNPKNIEAAFCISPILRSASTVLGDMQKLSRMFKEENHPSLELLRCSELIEKLLCDLFAPKRKLTDHHKAHILDLVKLFVGKDSLNEPTEIEKAISEALACTKSISIGVNIDKIDLAFLDAPIATMGIFQWMRLKLMDQEFLESGTSIFPAIIRLISEILEKQPLQRGDVLQLICEALPLIGNSLLSLSKKLLDTVTIVLVHGDVALFFGFCKNITNQKFDRSLIRHLLQQVLQMVSPPYSGLFASHMLKLMITSGIEKISSQDRLAPSKQMATVVSFLGACEDIRFEPGSLGPKEEGLLASMRP
jgi:negative elongation factor C/D